MIVFAIRKEKECEHNSRHSRKAIHIHDQRLVAASEFLLEDIKERLLGCNVILLLEKREGEEVGNGERQLSAFGFFSFVKVQLVVQERYFLLDGFI
jgi:hypothetical protein